MKIVEKNEGRKVPYELSGNWLNFDDQIMINLKSQEQDNDVHIDITSDIFGNLKMGEGAYYVAQVEIPARQYTEETIDNPDNDEGDETSSPTIIKREPVLFSMDNVTLYLFAVKEGVM